VLHSLPNSLNPKAVESDLTEEKEKNITTSGTEEPSGSPDDEENYPEAEISEVVESVEEPAVAQSADAPVNLPESPDIAEVKSEKPVDSGNPATNVGRNPESEHGEDSGPFDDRGPRRDRGDSGDRRGDHGGGRYSRGNRPMTAEEKFRAYKRQSDERLLDIKRSKEAKIGKKRKN